MNTITTREANKKEIDWINSRYAEVDFITSNFDNEFIVIAEVNEQKAGIGRLVVIDENNIELGGIYVFKEFRKMGVAENIVRFLCDANPFENRIIWCIPFENLKEFYGNFGFSKTKELKIPKEIENKQIWCNKTYDKKVLLLSKD